MERYVLEVSAMMFVVGNVWGTTLDYIQEQACLQKIRINVLRL